MSPPPSDLVQFGPEDWPERNPDGSMTLTAEQANAVAVTLTGVIRYIRIQDARCRRAQTE